MRAGILQSSYIPWRGYFDFIRSVDLFILFDDVAFGSKSSWRHRNQLKFETRLKWVTVPVKSKHDMAIDQVLIDTEGGDWRERHRRLITESIRQAPFFRDALGLWEKGTAENTLYLSRLNLKLIRSICEYLKIQTPIVDARDYSATGAKTERLVQLLKKAGADTYLSGPSGQAYIKEDLFRQNGIRLEYKTYDYPAYPQISGEFAGSVSVLDLIANVGPQAPEFLRSQTPNRIAV